MPGNTQLDPPSTKPKDPNRRLRRPVVVVTIVAAAVIPTAVLLLPRPIAALIAAAMCAVSLLTAFESGRRVGVALQRQACREGRRRG